MPHCFSRAVLFFMVGLAASWSLCPCPALALSIGEERLIGQKILYSVRRELQVLDDPDIHQYINRLGGKVLKVVGPQYFDYRFFVVKSEQFNAFAAPAGMVFFYSGLIEAMNREDELVSVMAHEIGHVASRHLASRLEKSTKVNMATALLGLAGLALGVPGLSESLLMGSLAAGQTANLRYSREDEEQADRLAFGWMTAMQRDPESMRSMLSTMRRITRYRMNEMPQYLLTHPNPEERVAYVDSLIELNRQKQPAPKWQPTDNFDFLRFRYRVLVQTSDLNRLRQSCTITSDREPNLESGRMARFCLALIEAQNRRFDQALSLLDQVRTQFPDRPVLDVDKAVVLQQAGRFAEARGILAAHVQTHPGDMYGLFQLARVEAAQGETQQAKRRFFAVARALPEYPQVWFELGQLEAARGEEGRGVFYLGKHYLYQGQEKLAEQNLKRASLDKSVPDSMRSEAREILANLEKIRKGT